ncbi:hypothetical protein XYCOK13_24550 [Xylanibacillus composti]|uniref:Acetyltransferase (GNAT) family protein n=2 Tax=Xylanibacillus composti TaxID=1572762 RepID=A0A8J4H519_9BACL|nr:hypothetical protein XYCOK13_24550 [Xylanibacillus composti]
MGIGSRLMDHAEQMIRERSRIAGLGVGIFSNYGAAQVLYAQRGYIPDGKGIHEGQRYIQHGETITVNDDIVFYLIKHLSRNDCSGERMCGEEGSWKSDTWSM